jgi:hypothetical protein
MREMQRRYSLDVLNWKPENALWRAKQFYLDRGFQLASENDCGAELRRGSLTSSLLSLHPSRMEQRVILRVAGAQGTPTRIDTRYEIHPHLHAVTQTVSRFWDTENDQLSLVMQRGYIDPHLDRHLNTELRKDLRRYASPYVGIILLCILIVAAGAAELWLIFSSVSN